MIKQRRHIKIKVTTNGVEKVKYNKIPHKITRALRKDKEQFINSICKEINQKWENSEPRELFKKISFLYGNYKPHYLPVKDEKGTTLTSNSQIIDRWKQYYEQLMSTNIQHCDNITEKKIDELGTNGCILSPLLFNIYGEWIIRKISEKLDDGVVCRRT